MSLTPEDVGAVSGQTPLRQEDLDGLIPDHIHNRQELNQWEAENIVAAKKELETRRSFDVLSIDALSELHKLMFGRTWRWAGTYSPTFSQFTDPRVPISVQMRELVEDTLQMLKASQRSPSDIDEIATRFHHRLVRIHPWRDGNGRHAREATDLLLRQYGLSAFSWGRGDLRRPGGARDAYLEAMKAADRGEFALLLKFVRS